MLDVANIPREASVRRSLPALPFAPLPMRPLRSALLALVLAPVSLAAQQTLAAATATCSDTTLAAPRRVALCRAEARRDTSLAETRWRLGWALLESDSVVAAEPA